MRNKKLLFLSAATAAVAALPVIARADTAFLDPTVNVVQLDNSTGGNNNAIALSPSPGPVTISASGNSSFGSLPGQQYDSLAVEYRDSSGKMQYGSVPNNGSNSFTGSNYDFAFLTDLQGAVPGNTGSTVVTELNAGNSQIGGGTIFAGSLDPTSQTGVAQISPAPTGNAAFFNFLTLQNYSVSVTGDAAYDAAGDQYGSVVVQYRDSTQGIMYDSLPIGSTKTYFGFNFRIFITDFAGQTADNSGSLTVTVNAVPEPATLTLAALGFTALVLVRRRARSN